MKPPPALFSAPGFRWEFITVDSMHAIDLGTFADAMGGVLFLEISQKSWHRSYQAGLDWLNAQLDGYYAANKGLSHLDFTLPMIKPTDGTHPTLRAKAAAGRHLAGFCLYIARRHQRHLYEFADERLRPRSAEYRALVVQVCQAMVDYHAACAAEPFVAEHCRAAMDSYVTTFHELRLLFRTNLPPHLHAAQVFAARPKYHLADHLVHQKVSLYGSPRHFWCYGDEDFVGLVKKICMQTRHPRSLERILLCKYRLYTALHAEALLQ